MLDSTGKAQYSLYFKWISTYCVTDYVNVSMTGSDALVDRLITMCDVGHDIIAEVEEMSTNSSKLKTFNFKKYKIYLNISNLSRPII